MNKMNLFEVKIQIFTGKKYQKRNMLNREFKVCPMKISQIGLVQKSHIIQFLLDPPSYQIDR